jgi:hypothetical protein
VKQAFNQNFEHEVVRGHFDVGTPPDAHRYYCLVDAKTGKREANGVGGKPFARPDGMTGLKEGAVSFYSCVSAEQQGILISDGYVLRDAAAAGAAGSGATRVLAPAAPAAAATAAAAAPHSDSLLQTEVRAAFARFIAGQNAQDPAAISALLVDGEDFVWAQMRGNSIWGKREAMETFQAYWKGSYRLDPQLEQLRITAVAPGVAVLITPLLLTQGGPGGSPATTPIRWAGVFVKTPSGWRIASIFITPFEGWRSGE